MNTQHTPGPWIATVPPSSCYVHRFIEAEQENGRNITLAEVGGKYSASDDQVSIFQHVANARLIAASPELLERLQMLEIAVAEFLNDSDRSFAAASSLSQEAVKARAAIAKATQAA